MVAPIARRLGRRGAPTQRRGVSYARRRHPCPATCFCAPFFLLVLVACTAQPVPTPALVPAPALPAPVEALPAADVVPGWQLVEAAKTFIPDTLFDFMDGAADLYFTYGFQELAVGLYRDAQDRAVQVEVYRTATDADAYGLFGYNAFGEAERIGVDGELESGSRLAFWQARTYVQIVARQQVQDEVLRAFAHAVSAALPEGGERPALVAALPTGGLAAGNVRFFREKMALDNLLWLGADDPLGLGPDTQGVVARYEVGGQPADLLLLAYPDAARAEAGLAGLRSAGIETLAGARVEGATLGAAFGSGAAAGLLDEVGW